MNELIKIIACSTIGAVAAIVLNLLANMFHFPGFYGFAPISTAFAAVLVGAPLSYRLIRQGFDTGKIKQELLECIALADRAFVETHQRRKEAEDTRARAEAALASLAESEARYRMITERATDIIVRYDPQGLVEYASPSVRRLGYEPDMIIGQNLAAFVHPEDVAISKAAEGENALLGGQSEWRVRAANGAWVWLEGSPAPIFDNDGHPAGAIALLRDVTARRAMEDELRRKRDEAEAAVVAKSDFLANMTHELRTPLNAIIGFSGLLKQSEALSPGDRRKIDLIGDAGETLLHVVNDVLDYSKLEAGAIALEHRPFDPLEAADSVAAMLGGQALDKGLTLAVSAEGLTGPLLGDGARLRQVLLNLVSNAIKFTAQGGVEIRVGQSGDHRNRRLLIEVEDTGIGLNPEQLDTIFGRFTQADASVSRQYGGTGLGLAISKRIVEAMGGQIGVVSQAGLGATFWLEAPMEAAKPASEEAAFPAEPLALEQTLRLLVVEDNGVNRELITTLLAPFDLEIETATDGIEAIEAAARSQFDLILMDVQMPNMDGLTATRRIRASREPRARRVPIIAMTANVLPDQVERCLEAGMDDHLGKPINPSMLLEVLARWSSGEKAGRHRTDAASAA